MRFDQAERDTVTSGYPAVQIGNTQNVLAKTLRRVISDMSAVASHAEFVPATQAELARFMAENAVQARKTLRPVGGRTALTYPVAPSDVVISLSDLKRIVDYPARDMTITVEAGIRIDELQTQLAAAGQRLPIDIAQASRATLGGAIATNTSGPRRFGHGTFRDYVIGISAVDSMGDLFKAGGRVVKNVAGYDICKVMIGSRGTLGVITQATLKLRPLAETSAFLWLNLPTLDQIEPALERLQLSQARPVAVEVLNPSAAKLVATAARSQSHPNSSVLCIGLEGTRREVDWQVDTLMQELSTCAIQSHERIAEPDAARLWSALTEFPVCADDPLTFQANLLPSQCIEFANRATQQGVAVQVHAGNGIIIGQLPEEAATIERATSILRDLRRHAKSARGNLQILHCDPEWTGQVPMNGDPEPGASLMKRLKQQLDPQNLLNPGQFVDVGPVS